MHKKGGKILGKERKNEGNTERNIKKDKMEKDKGNTERKKERKKEELLLNNYSCCVPSCRTPFH